MFAQSGRDYVYGVGSSTVYPFATIVAERFGRGAEFKTAVLGMMPRGCFPRADGRCLTDLPANRLTRLCARRHMLEARPQHQSFSASRTHAFYAGILSEEQVESMSQSICTNLPMGHDSLCAIFGYGARPTSTYRWLSRLSGVEVPWDGNFGPWWLAPLLWIAASRGGLVIVEARDKVTPVLDALGSLAMVELFSCSSNLRDEMTRHVQENTWRSHPGSIASTDNDYFAFGFDGDSSDPDGGIYTWCAVGNGCPRELSDCLSDYIAGL